MQRAAALYQRSAVDSAVSAAELRLAMEDSDELVRQVAGIQLAFRYPSEVQQATVHEMVATLIRVSHFPPIQPICNEYAVASDEGEVCWDLGQHIALALMNMPAGSADDAIPDLIALWRRDRQFYEAALAALALAFPIGGSPVVESLSKPQQSLLLALTEDGPIWDLCRQTADELDARGLPKTRNEMRRWLGL